MLIDFDKHIQSIIGVHIPSSNISIPQVDDVYKLDEDDMTEPFEPESSKEDEDKLTDVNCDHLLSVEVFITHRGHNENWKVVVLDRKLNDADV